MRTREGSAFPLAPSLPLLPLFVSYRRRHFEYALFTTLATNIRRTLTVTLRIFGARSLSRKRALREKRERFTCQVFTRAFSVARIAVAYNTYKKRIFFRKNFRPKNVLYLTHLRDRGR